MGYWKAKVLPKIKQIFDKNGPKKTAAAEACKTFDEAKEEYSKEFEEKKSELQPKVVEIYEAAAVEIKSLVKERKGAAGLKKNSDGVQKFLDELVKIEFPGSKAVSEASSNFGPSYVSGPILFVLEKVSTFIVVTEEVEVKEKEIVTEEPPAVVADAPAPKVEEEAPTATKVEEEAPAATKVEEEAPKA